MQGKTVRFANTPLVQTSPVKKSSVKKSAVVPGGPAAPSAATKTLGFDFVEFQQQTEPRASKFTHRKWLQGGNGTVTRKWFGGAGKNFWERNSSKDLVERAEPASNALNLEFPGPKVSAATKAVTKGKIEDTRTFYGHLKVLVAAQKKWEAKLPMEQAKQELDEAAQALSTYHTEILRLQHEGLATARQRLDGMKQRRDEALGLKGAPDLPATQARQLGKAKHIAANLVRKATVPAAVPNQEPKGKVLTKAKRALLSRMAPSKEGSEKAKQKARMAELSKAAERKPTEVVVDHEALHKEIAARAKARGETPQEYIEFLLLDNDVGAYLPPVLFDALYHVHAQLSQHAQKEFLAEAKASLALGKQRIDELVSAYQEARVAYDALPMPG